MRREAGLNLTEAASKLDLTRSALHRLESGVSQINVHVVRSMMDVYDQYVPNLLETVREARQRGWWRGYSVANRDYLGWETGASHIREVATLRLPDLLQTADYARAARPRRPGTQLSQWTQRRTDEVGARAIRQRRLTDPDDTLAFTAVIDESALRSQVCDAAASKVQFDCLVEFTALPTVDIRVLTYTAGVRSNGFRLLSFDQPDDLPLAFVDQLDEAVRVDDQRRVAAAQQIFDEVVSAALPRAESAEFILQVTRERHATPIRTQKESA